MPFWARYSLKSCLRLLSWRWSSRCESGISTSASKASEVGMPCMRAVACGAVTVNGMEGWGFGYANRRQANTGTQCDWGDNMRDGTFYAADILRTPERHNSRRARACQARDAAMLKTGML